MTRSLRLLLALALILPVVGACSMDPNGPDLPAGGQLCGSAAPSDGSCADIPPQGDLAR